MLHRLVGTDSHGAILVSIHNVYYMQRLMREIREAIVQQKFCTPSFMAQQYPEGAPGWVVNAPRPPKSTFEILFVGCWLLLLLVSPVLS